MLVEMILRMRCLTHAKTELQRFPASLKNVLSASRNPGATHLRIALSTLYPIEDEPDNKRGCQRDIEMST